MGHCPVWDSKAIGATPHSVSGEETEQCALIVGRDSISLTISTDGQRVNCVSAIVTP
jgi:hypothetical protein